MFRVLVSSPLVQGALDPLDGLATVEIGSNPRGLGGPAIAERIGDKHALISLLGDVIDASVLDRAPELKIIANHAVGVDNIDLGECEQRGIVVSNTPDVLTDATADFAFALLLAACRRVVEADGFARSGAWRGWAPTEWLGLPVSGATLGIVGCGRIGRAVAKRARGFGMRVLYSQRTPLPEETERELGISYRHLRDLLGESDIVTLHCPLTSSTHGLLSRERIAQMKRGSVLINTSRGACVSEEALAEALRSGQIAAAGLDVYENEPSIFPLLQKLENVVLAPHIASADRPTRLAMGRLCAQAVRQALTGEPVEHRVVG